MIKENKVDENQKEELEERRRGNNYQNQIKPIIFFSLFPPFHIFLLFPLFLFIYYSNVSPSSSSFPLSSHLLLFFPKLFNFFLPPHPPPISLFSLHLSLLSLFLLSSPPFFLSFNTCSIYVLILFGFCSSFV